LHRNLFNDGAFNLLEKQALSGRLKPVNSQQSFSSPARPVLPTDINFSDMPTVSSVPEPNFDGSESSLHSVDKNSFFYQRMKMLAANFQDRNNSHSSSSDIKEEPIADETGFNWSKPVQTHQNSTPVSPQSPRHIR